LVGESTVGAGYLKVLHHALYRVVTVLNRGVASDGDPDRPVRLGRDEGGILETEGPACPAEVGPVIEVRHLFTRSTVQDLYPLSGRHDDVLVALAEVRRRDGAVDRAEHWRAPDRSSGRRVQRVRSEERRVG